VGSSDKRMGFEVGGTSGSTLGTIDRMTATKLKLVGPSGDTYVVIAMDLSSGISVRTRRANWPSIRIV
jgi:hypothetical protein